MLISLGRVQDAHDLSREIVAESGEACEPRSRCMYLIVLVMSQLVLGELTAAQATLDRIAQIPAASADERIGSFLVNRRALLALLQAGPAAAEAQLLAVQAAPTAPETALERALVRALIALVQGDRGRVEQLTTAVSQQAAANYVFYQLVAHQIAAADPAVPPAELPRLLWCQADRLDAAVFAPAAAIATYPL